MTALQDAVLVVLRAYERARLTLDRDQRRVLRSILASRVAKDVVDEELEVDRAEMEDAA